MNRNTKVIKSYEYLTDWWEDLMTFINPGKKLICLKKQHLLIAFDCVGRCITLIFKHLVF